MSSFSKPLGEIEILDYEESILTLSLEVEKRHTNFQGHEYGSIFCVNSILSFPHPHNKIVSCFMSIIHVWCSETLECLATISQSHRNEINQLKKFNENSFLSCSDDKSICCFSVSSPKFEQLKRFDMGSSAYNLLVLTEELILCHCHFSILYILDFPKSEIVKKFFVGKIHEPIASLLLSQKYPYCFYFTSDSSKDIKFIDYEDSKIVKEFKEYEKEHGEKYLFLFLNSRNEEILIVSHQSFGEEAPTFHFYNVSHPQFSLLNKKISPLESKMDDFVLPTSPKWGISFNNQYLFCGDQNGSVHSFEVVERGPGCMRRVHIPHEDDSVKTAALLIQKGQYSRTRMAFFSTVKTEIYRVNGFVPKDRTCKRTLHEVQDLGERIDFVVNETEKIFFGEKGRDIVHIRIWKMDLLSVSKLFLRR